MLHPRLTYNSVRIVRIRLRKSYSALLKSQKRSGQTGLQSSHIPMLLSSLHCNVHANSAKTKFLAVKNVF